MTDEFFLELLRTARRYEAHAYWLGDLGGSTMSDHALRRVARGEIEPGEAIRIVGLNRTRHRLLNRQHAS